MSTAWKIILPISEKFADYAREVKATLDVKGIACTIDNRDEKIGRKIRDAEVSKTPFMLIVGEKEKEEGRLSVRKQSKGDIGSMYVEEFIEHFDTIIDEEINELIC